jgi:pilus assembly protein Flp/PilA
LRWNYFARPAFGVLIMQSLVAFANDESGATAIEYGLIASLISIVAITAMNAVGTSLSMKFSQIAGNLQ